MAKKTKNSANLFSAILYLVLGIVLIAFPGSALSWAMTAAGIIFIVSGILDIIKKNFVGGLVSLVFGIAILVLGWLFAKIVLLILGILIGLKGIVDLINALKASKVTVLGVLFPILTIVLGCALAFGNAIGWIIIVIGAFLIVDGVLGLIACLKK